MPYVPTLVRLRLTICGPSRSLTDKTTWQKGYASIRQTGREDHIDGGYIQEALKIVKLLELVHRICSKLSLYMSMGV